MPKIYDFVVVGAGTMGRSTALYLTLQYPEAKCALIEQYTFTHEHGSSHASTRIIRSTYSNPYYRDLCLLGISKHWKQVEQLLNTQILVNQPYLKYIHDDKLYKEQVEAAKSSANIKIVGVEDVRKRFPSAPEIELNGKSLFLDEEAGIVMAHRYMKGLEKYLRRQKNVDIFEETEVVSINNDSKGVELKVKDKNDKVQEIFAPKVALTCGRWMSRLVPVLSKVLTPMRQIVSYWDMLVPQDYKIPNSPCWSEWRQDCDIFCLPDVQDSGLKYAVCSYNYVEEQKLPEREYVMLQVRKTIENMEIHYPGKFHKLKKVDNCYYTYTKTEDFLIDWTDEHQNVMVVSACSGHGFKFSPVIGNIVADLLKDDRTTIELFMKNRYLARMAYHTGMNLE